MTKKLNPSVHPLQHLSGNNNPHYIDIAQSTLLTVTMDACDSIRFRALDKSTPMQHLRFTRQKADLHVFLDNGHEAVIIENYFNDPVNIYAIDEQDMPHLYIANGTDVYSLANLADGESITQTLASLPTSDDSITDISVEDSIILDSDEDDDNNDGFLAGLLSDGALAVAGGIAAAGLAGVAIASANKGEGDSHDDKHQNDNSPPTAINSEDIRVIDDEGNRIHAGGMTADSTPTISGRVDAAEAGGKVIIRDHGITIGEATIGKDGSWSMTVTPALKDGEHNLSAVVEDKAGNHSLPSENIDIGVDTIAPDQANEIVLTDDHGKLINGITNDKTPTVSGKGEAGATVVLKDSYDKVLGTATVDNNGDWNITPGELEDGDHALSVEQSDKAGNTSVVHLPALTIDTEIKPLGDITLTDKNGNILEGGATNTGMPDIKGKGEAGSTVVVTDEKGSAVGSTTVDKDGNWTVKPQKPLVEGSHDLTVDITDPAGNHTSAPLPVEIDSVAPNKVENIVVTDDHHQNITDITKDSTPTVSGKGEVGATVTLKDSNDKVLGTATVDNNGDWSLAPDALKDGIHDLKVEQSDSAGNVSPAVQLPALQVDTTAPAAVTEVEVKDDSGAAITDITGDSTPTVSGKGEPGATVTLKDGGGNALGSSTVGEDGSWSITPDAFKDGNHDLTVEQRDSAGNVSPAVQLPALQVDTTAPVAVTDVEIKDDSGAAVTDITGDSTPTVSGKGEPGATVTLKDGGGNTLGSSTVAEDGSWSITPEALKDGKYDLTVEQSDSAGNISPAFDLPAVEIDTRVPGAVTDVVLIDDSGKTIVDVTNDSTPTVSGKGEPGATVTLKDGGGTVLGSTTVNDEGNWSITSETLKDGKYDLKVEQTNKAGSTASLNLPTVDIDTAVPAEASDIKVTNDSGELISGVTSDSTPTVSGKGEPGATVTLKDGGGNALGSSTVGEDGSWSITPGALEDGNYDLKVEQRDSAGNVSLAVQLPALQVDTTAPAAVTEVEVKDDSGAAITDITGDSTPTVSGKGEVGATVTLKDSNDKVLGTATVDNNGDWSLAPDALKDGIHNLKVEQSDSAGNVSPAVQLPALQVDTTAPVAVTDVEIKDDSGAAVTDITGDSTPAVSGKGEPGATVTLKDGGGNALGSSIVGEDGSWSITPGALEDGKYDLKVEQRDSAGNVSPAVQLPALEVDTTAPTAAENITLTDKAGDDVTGTDTNTKTPVIRGEAEPDSMVTITDKAGNVIGSAKADKDGHWSITPDKALADGDQTLTVTVKDAVGNAVSSSLEVSVDSVAPDAPDNVALISNLSGTDVAIIEGLTNDNTVVLTGHAEKNSLVTIHDGETVLGKVTADEEGNWRFELPEDKKLKDGDHTLVVTATDSYGNVSDETALPLRVDTTNNNMTTLNTLDGSNSTDTDIPRVSGKVDLKDGDSPESVKVLIFDDVDGDGIYDKNVDKLLATVDSIDVDGSWKAQLKSMTEGEHHIKAVVVDAAGNPSQVSNLNGSSNGSLEVNAPERSSLSGYNEGSTTGNIAQFGTVVKNIGHFSGDGYDDIAISAPSGGAPGKTGYGGMVYVLFGNKTGLLSQYSDVHKLFEEHPEVGLRIYNSGTVKDGNNITTPTTDRMAQDIVKVDLNGDGIDDLVIASHWNDKLYVIWGDQIRDGQLSELDLHDIDLGNNVYGFSVTVDSDDWFAYSNTAYDYTGDGVQDLVIGNIDGAYDGAGGAYVLKGSKDPQHKWSNIKLNKTEKDAQHPGGGFASANGEEDGYYIHHEVQGSKTQNQNFGNSIQSVGDVNGDGQEDFIIIDDVSVHDGCYGTAYLIYGQEGGINKTINISSLDEDHMVRIQNMNTTWFGAVDPGTVIAGGPGAGIETEPNQKVIASLGDFYNDGDKSSDFAIAAPQDAVRGKVWIFRGKSEIGTHGELHVGASGNNHLAIDDGFAIVSSNKSGTKSFGSRILGTYDINGDGIPDLIISDPTAINAAGKAVGAVYVVYGGHTADYVMDSNNEISIDTLLQKGLAEVHWGEVTNGHFGSDLDVADMNGDGRMDIIVGANGHYNTATGNGSITIIYNHHDVMESKAAAMNTMSLEPDSHAMTEGSALILDGDHQNVDLASLTQSLKALHHVDLADGENTLTVSSNELKALSEGQDANAPALTVEGENGNVALTGGQDSWHEGGKVEVNGTVYQAWESSSHSQILVDDRIHVTVL